jgi:hypothetical protein
MAERTNASSFTGTGGKGVAVRFPDQAPPITGFSDSCRIVGRDTFQEIVFLDSLAERAIARIVVDNAMFAEYLWGTSSQFHAETTKWLGDVGMAQVAATGEPSQDAIKSARPVACNFFTMARVGTEAVFEGYYVSPKAVHVASSAREPKPIPLEPICRIQLPVPVLVGLLSEVKRKVEGG